MINAARTAIGTLLVKAGMKIMPARTMTEKEKAEVRAAKAEWGVDTP